MATAVLCSAPARPAAFPPAPAAHAWPLPQQAQQVRRYGPFPTMRRANEVAEDFRQRGCRANAFHNGDGYYVDVRC